MGIGSEQKGLEISNLDITRQRSVQLSTLCGNCVGIVCSHVSHAGLTAFF